MKKMILGMMMLLAVPNVYGQTPLYAQHAYILPQKLAVTYQKTTSLIFPASITSVDRGNADIIVQKTEGVENVLKVKAARAGFDETNLTVITADGQFFTFTVNYSPAPLTFAVFVKSAPIQAAPGVNGMEPIKAVFATNSTNETRLRKQAAQASISKANIKGVHDESFGMNLSLTGLFIADDRFFYKLVVQNETNIQYDIASIDWYIRDHKRVKRMATQETSLEPIIIIGDEMPIPPHTQRMIIAVLPKQTIAANKRLVIELDENKGGRKLACTLRSKTLLKAKPIAVTKAVDNIPNILAPGN